MFRKNDFPVVRYAQSWEDPGSLTKALAVTPEDDVLSIGSSGDNSFAILLNSPRSLTLIDRNPAQIFLIELKMRAIRALDYEDFAGFIGARDCSVRLQLYKSVRAGLSDESRRYWDEHPESILKGVIHCGKLEKYFAILRRFMLPLVHTKDSIEQLLKSETLEEQRNFYEQVWNNRRWQSLFRIFFGEFLLGRLGRDPSCYRYVTTGGVAEELLRRCRRGLTEIPIRENYFVEYIVTGGYTNLDAAHPYLRQENFLLLRERVDEIRLVNKSLDEYLINLPPDSVSKLNLSDIFEYMSADEYERTMSELLRVCRDEARLAFWALFVPRSVPLSLTEQVNPCSSVSASIFAADRTFFYENFYLWQKKPAFENSSRTNKEDGIKVGLAVKD